MTAPILAVALTACAGRLGAPAVRYGADDATLALVHPSTDRQRWYVTADAGDAGAWLWFVDTGYSYTTCDDDFVAALGVDPFGHKVSRGELGDVPGSKARLPEIAAGTHRVARMTCLVRDLATTSSLGAPPEVPLAGVIGIDVLRRFRVELDPGAAVIRLRDPRPLDPLPKDGAGVVPLRAAAPLELRVAVPIAIGEAEARPLLDTGAGSTHLDGDRLGLVPTRTAQGVPVYGSGPGGHALVDGAWYDDTHLRLGDLALDPIVLTHRPRRHGVDGLLGLDVLDQVGTELDFRRHRARFTPTDPAPVPAWTAEQPAALVIGAP